MVVQEKKFNDFYFRLIGIPIVGFFIPLLFFNMRFENSLGNWLTILSSIFYTAIYWTICRTVYIWGDRRYPDIKDNKKRIIFVFFICAAFIFSFCNLMHLFFQTYFHMPLVIIPDQTRINGASFVSFLTITTIYEAIRYFVLLQKTLVEKEVLAKANLQSQLEGLKNQVNPHFLFNSLNTLVHIIPENPDNAVRFVQKLSKVYRYILEMRDASTTPLATELAFLEAYIFLLKERFGDNFRVTIDIDTEGGAKNMAIVPLSLQILFENALKHNIISVQKPLFISVFVENDKLIVRNNFQPKNQVQEGTSVGLENIKNRYTLVSQQRVEIIVTSQYFTVALPLLKD